LDHGFFFGVTMIAKALVPAVAYLRASSDKQDTSCDDQLAEVKKYAAKNGYKLLRWKEYTDDGISGDDMDRPGFQRLIRDAARLHDFDVVLCWDQSRFSRGDVLDTAVVWRDLRNAKVKLVTVTKGEVDFTTIGGIITASVTQYGDNDFLGKLAHGVLRGQLERVHQGKWISGVPPFGYAVSEDTGRLVINEAQAAIVRELFTRIATESISFFALARDLNERGFLSPAGRKWSDRAIKYMLSNEVYLGRLVIGKTPKGKHVRLIAGDRVATNGAKPCKMPRSECVIVEDTHPALVTLEHWSCVQDVLAGRKQRKWTPRTTSFPLSGLLWCGHCGARVAGHRDARHPDRYQYYLCQSHKDATTDRKADCRYCLNAGKVLAAVREHAETAFLSEARISKLRSEAAKVLRRRHGEDRSKLARLQAEINKLTKQLDKAESRLLITPEDILEPLYRQIRKLKGELDRLSLEKSIEERASEVTTQLVGDDCQELVNYLRGVRERVESDDPAEVRAGLSSLIESIHLYAKPVPLEARKGWAQGVKQKELLQVRIAYKLDLSNSKAVVSSRG